MENVNIWFIIVTWLLSYRIIEQLNSDTSLLRLSLL